MFEGYPDFFDFNSFLFFGFVDVQIFFVISGYVIANSCEGRSPGQFAAGRVKRIIPILWLSALVIGTIKLAAGAPLIGVLEYP